MTELEKLVLHLEQLKKNKSKSVTLDINFLLSVLRSTPTQAVSVIKAPIDRKEKVIVDGGTFND